MASVLDLLPIVTIFSIGGSGIFLLEKFKRLNLRLTEIYNLLLLLGTAILIIPFTWIGIQNEGRFYFPNKEIGLIIIDFQSWALVYFVFGLILTIVAIYKGLRILLAKLEDLSFSLENWKDIRIGLIMVLIVEYLFLELILPLRGFDALYYYFPEARTFIEAGRITEVNYLSFLPVVKSPLHVLLFVYSYYITGGFHIQLIPFVFLLGLLFLLYDFSIEIFSKKSIAYTSSLLLLVLPFTYWLMNYWVFYQDLYLCYFFSLACYLSYKWLKTQEKHEYGLFLLLGIILSLLTKITSWLLPVILILWLPTGKIGKMTRIAIIIPLALYLSFLSATKIFVGGIFPIIISLGLTIFLIFKEPIIKKGFLVRFSPVALGTLIGSFWLLNRISKSISVWNEIFTLYFDISDSIILEYPLPPDNPLLLILERMHSVNYFSATSILLLGTLFVLPWIAPKFSSLKNYKPITPLLIWILLFFSFWTAYYLNGSIRYLAPIIVPMVLCVSWGINQIIENLDSRSLNNLIISLFAFMGCSSFYYLFSLESIDISDQTQEIIGFAYNKAAYDYYSHPEILIAVGLAILVVFTLIMKKKNYFTRFKSRNVTIVLNGFTIFFIGMTILIPIVVQSYLLIYSQGNIEEFQGIIEYEYRPEYKELVNVILQQNQPFSAIMTVRTPGLQFFVGQPVVDIYYQQNVFIGNPFMEGSDLAEIVEILQDPIKHIYLSDMNLDIILPIKFIVVPAEANLYYNSYIQQIKSKSLLFQSLAYSNYFNQIFENSDYILYEVISS
ncbi:MAG: hypothetical protein EAX89_10790 [Candidatus Lokiarchaeota archaeon]|nr:hypothetical protein [Candidatus Lokiarchaeota archaeon]